MAVHYHNSQTHTHTYNSQSHTHDHDHDQDHTHTSENHIHDEGDVKTSNWQEKAINYFQSKGVRWTPQRQLILAALENSHGHVSAEEIYQEVIRTFPRVNISTVYRTLELLAEMELLVKVPNLIEDRDRFELVTETLHHHLICKNCGKEIELDGHAIDDLKKKALKQYGFTLELNHFVGYGLCKDCRLEAAETGK